MPMHSADEAIRSGMTGPDVGTARQAGRIAGLRGNSLGISLMLIAEYGLGIGVNLYVHIPAADRGNGIAATPDISRSYSATVVLPSNALASRFRGHVTLRDRVSVEVDRTLR